MATKITLRHDEAALVIRADGAHHMHLPADYDDKDPPWNVLVTVAMATSLANPNAVHRLLELLEQSLKELR
jgi:hypothetical protein